MILINSTDKDQIVSGLKEQSAMSLHFTNGTYSYEAETIVPTTIAGFRYLSEKKGNENDAFVIAVNSDKSMAAIMDQKDASDEERAALEDQETRAMKVAVPLLKAFPGRNVIILFYDEETPTALYDVLAEEGEFEMKSLHKWGYGTDPNAPKIEGAHNFSTVYGFPIPNDKRPVCWDLTEHEDQSEVVKVVRLDSYIPAARQAAGFPPPQPSQ
ncbi:MAG: hypothetical protein AAF988_03215 [Pseudomonadota bacterium]